jgi:hypothetical protein
MIILDEEDWIEIFYALDTKVLCWDDQGDVCGHLPCEHGCKDSWTNHLREIQRKIGPDGCRAWQLGVAPRLRKERIREQ